MSQYAVIVQNDELGEQLVKGYVKKNNSNIATITSNFI